MHRAYDDIMEYKNIFMIIINKQFINLKGLMIWHVIKYLSSRGPPTSMARTISLLTIEPFAFLSWRNSLLRYQYISVLLFNDYKLHILQTILKTRLECTAKKLH